MIMRPGLYLSKRRAAAKLSIEDVAGQISCEPSLAERERVEWLGRIEQDVAPVTLSVAHALQPVFPFDVRVLMSLVRLQDGEQISAPRICSVCACTERDPCDDHGRGCYWAGPEICSCCVGAEKREQAA